MENELSCALMSSSWLSPTSTLSDSRLLWCLESYVLAHNFLGSRLQIVGAKKRELESRSLLRTGVPNSRHVASASTPSCSHLLWCFLFQDMCLCSPTVKTHIQLHDNSKRSRVTDERRGTNRTPQILSPPSRLDSFVPGLMRVAGPLWSATRNAPFFMISLCISSNHTMRGNSSHVVVWSLATSHDTAVHLPTVKVFLAGSDVQLDLFLPCPIK